MSATADITPVYMCSRLITVMYVEVQRRHIPASHAMTQMRHSKMCPATYGQNLPLPLNAYFLAAVQRCMTATSTNPNKVY